MGYVADKIGNSPNLSLGSGVSRKLNSVGRRASSVESESNAVRSNLLNQNPSQRSSSLRNITQPVSGTVTSVGGTVSNVGHVVAKVAGKFGMTGLQEMLEGKSTTTWNDTYGEWGSERSGKRLKDFFLKMKTSKNARIDTLNTFEMTIDFDPSPGSFQGIKDMSKAERSVVGTLFKERFSYSKADDSNAKIGDLVFDMGIYVQKMALPNISLANGQSVKTALGEFPVNGLYLQPDNHTFSLEILNLEKPMGEDIFYKWMREVVAPFWIYSTQPYTTAKVTIDLTEHADLRYVFLNCRPTSIMTVQPTQEMSQNFTRQVQFAFDWMYAESPGATPRKVLSPVMSSLDTQEKETTLDKITRIGNAANFSA